MTPQFTVVKGNPTEDEIQAIAQVLAQLQAANAPQADRNGWGAPRPAYHQAALYNPHAFGSVGYF